MKQEKYKNQMIISQVEPFECVGQILTEKHIRKVLVVCSESAVKRYDIGFSEHYAGNIKFFHAFSANPKYEEVVNGVELFCDNDCEAVVSVGGGSAIDVAKCIKAFAGMDANQNYLQQKIEQNHICHIAVPTTAGTGSESTCFAVTYYQGEKKSVADISILPDYAVLCPDFLIFLPLYKKKATVLDALCQGIESYWSVNATEESRGYAAQAIRGILANVWDYVERSGQTAQIMDAANLAGRAINISKTTAAHAMSYKLTSIYGLSHGHAVALCLPKTWRFLNGALVNSENEKLKMTLQELANIMGTKSSKEAVDVFEKLLARMNLESPKRAKDKDIDLLVKSVNIERLRNFPVAITEEQLREMYLQIVE